MKNVLIMYGPRGGYTEKVADSIKQKLINHNAKCVPGSMVTLNTLEEYDSIIIGIATLGNDSWANGRHDIDVNNISALLNSANLKDKTIALYGLGNLVLYPAHFCDDMGAIEEIISKKGAKVIGFTSTEGYSIKDSKAVRGKEFCGLALDHDTEFAKTDARITSWVDKISILL